MKDIFNIYLGIILIYYMDVPFHIIAGWLLLGYYIIIIIGLLLINLGVKAFGI